MKNIEPLYIRFDEYAFDEANVRLTRRGQAISLAPKAFAVLCVLLRRPGQLLTKDELLDAVWGHQYVSESVLKTVISELRAALSDDPKQPRYIETIARHGYRFLSQVLQTTQGQGSLITQIAASPIIGRQAALAKMSAAWQGASTGRRQIFWIAGEAGIGKTTLIENFVAGLDPIRHAHGQCVEQFGTGEPYLPVLEALATLCRDDPALVPLMRAVAPTWLLQLPWLSSEGEREALRRELAGTSQDRMLREFGELLERATQQQTLLLVTEDLHWSDHATVYLINHIARRRDAARLMWLASFRLAEVISEDHPLKGLRHELRLHRLCEEIVLDPFSEQEVAQYLDRRYPGSEISEAFVRNVHMHTDGLPLFVVNVIEDLVAQGALQNSSQAMLADKPIILLQVPENLAGVIEKQISRLSPEERSVLEAASVCGVEFRSETVAEALGQDVRATVALLDELARRRQWISSPVADQLEGGPADARYGFSHALYQHVFYQHIGALRRSTLHGRVAASLARSRGAGSVVTAAELASHYERSHDLMAALRYYAEAAENALRHFAPQEALDLTAHALAFLPHCPASEARNALELALCAMRGVAAAQLLGVSALETKRIHERAQTLLEGFPQHPLRSLVLHGLGLVLFVRGEYAQTRALGERLHALSQAQNDRILFLCACNLLGQVSALEGKNLEAVEWMDQGIAQCNAIGEAALQAAFLVDPEVTMYGAVAIPLLHLGRIDQARARIAAALTRAQSLGQPMSQMVVNWFAALVALRLGETDRVAAHAVALREIVDNAALAQGEGPSQWFRGWAEAQHGAARDGHQRIHAAYQYNVSLGMLSGASEVLCYGAEALVLAEEWSPAQEQLDEAIRLAQRLGERVYLPQMLTLQGRIAHGQGDRAGARAALQAALREACEQRALWLEIAARVALCELGRPASRDLDSLRRACAKLSEGLDTGLVRRAHALLASKARSPGA